ncbi:MAG TPA: hypothetical protein VHX49_10400 [Candidatus Acidoferrales bacterium]|jgi:hypothetical protein|nr:hypothetical protein [Candidatus Acidoferrales bacterium]
MTIEKKSLISTLKTTKKANAVKDDISGTTTVSPSQKSLVMRKAAAKHALAKKAASKR